MSAEHQLLLQHQRERIALEYRHLQEIAQVKGNMLVYPNQREAANKCIDHFINGKMLVMLIAQPGMGKTGCALEILRQIALHIDDDKCVKASNIHIISGMDDTDWRDQFQSKMLPSFREHVRHRSALTKSKDKIADIRNGLIVTDECHIASDKNMTVSNVIRAAGLTDINVVQDRQVKMLEISATPEAESWDLESWGDKAEVVRLLPGPTYKGFEVMLSEDRIREAQPLNTAAKVNELLKFFDDRYKSTTKKYFPMRIQNPDWIGLIHSAIVRSGWTHMRHDSSHRVENIDDIMASAPKKHTIIFVKGFWRASKRLTRTHIGGSYQQVSKFRNVSVAAQDLIARHCDNYEYEGDELNPHLRPVHFGDRASIEAYVEWFNKGCDYRLAHYKSSRINSFNGHVKGKASKLHATNFTNLDPVPVQNNDPDTHKRVPVVIPVNEAFVKAIGESETVRKLSLVKTALSRLLANKPTYAEFLAIIATSPCFQMSTPDPDSIRSYKIHIEDVVQAFEEDRKYGLMDVKEEFKKKTCWQVYIDKVNFRLCILWQVFLNIEEEEETQQS
jgi:hypothetical protein